MAKKMLATNKANAGLKIYHHKTGGGGYAGCKPKWAAAEAELRRKKSSQLQLAGPEGQEIGCLGIVRVITWKLGS